MSRNDVPDSDLRRDLHEIARKSAESAGLELYHLEFHPAGHGAMLRVYIDSPAGVGLEECERVSRRLSAELEIEDLIPGKYTLEVSSPGIERILATPEHFQRAAGRLAVVRTSVAIDGTRRHEGRISAFLGGILEIEKPGGAILRIPFDQISTAHVAFEAGGSTG